MRATLWHSITHKVPHALYQKGTKDENKKNLFTPYTHRHHKPLR